MYIRIRMYVTEVNVGSYSELGFYIIIMTTYLYEEKSHSYGMTVKLGVTPTPTPYAYVLAYKVTQVPYNTCDTDNVHLYMYTLQ